MKFFDAFRMKQVAGEDIAHLRKLEMELVFDRSRLTTVEELCAMGPTVSKDSDVLLIARELLAHHANLAGAVAAADEVSTSLARCRALEEQAQGSQGDRATVIAELVQEQSRLQRLLAARIRRLKRANPAYRSMQLRVWCRRLAAVAVAFVVVGVAVRVSVTNVALMNYYKRSTDFKTIVAALDHYRKDRGLYPISADDGASWNGIGWKGEKAAWIPGLVPTYLPALPADPRNTEIAHAQYIYRSDGKDYKLIALLPEDCRRVIRKYPEVSDPARNTGGQCVAYGLWTNGAKAW